MLCKETVENGYVVDTEIASVRVKYCYKFELLG